MNLRVLDLLCASSASNGIISASGKWWNTYRTLHINLDWSKIMRLFMLPIPGYKKHYSITISGRVWSHKRKHWIASQISKAGYLRVELWKDGTANKHSIHRILAETFLPIANMEVLTVNHRNGVKADNNLDNLEWLTQSENQKHAYRIGLQKGYRKPGIKLSSSHKRALCGSRWNYETHIYTLAGHEFRNLWDAAAHFNVSRQTILNRCKSEKWPGWDKKIVMAGGKK